MATKNKHNENNQETKPPVPTTEQLLARVYPLASGSRVKVEPKATDLCRVRLKHWLKKNNNRKKKEKENAPG